MKTARRTLVGRITLALGRLLGSRSDPKLAARWLRAARWDYDQANAQPRDGEPDRVRLNAALTILQTDKSMALPLLRELAEAGSPVAANSVGEAYRNGWGVAVDEEVAEQWFRLAFERGRRRAMLNLGWLLFAQWRLDEAEQVFMVGVQDDWPPAFYWLARVQAARAPLTTLGSVRRLMERAAEGGSPAAKGALGALLALGVGGAAQMRRGWRLIGEWGEEPAIETPAGASAEAIA